MVHLTAEPQGQQQQLQERCPPVFALGCSGAAIAAGLQSPCVLEDCQVIDIGKSLGHAGLYDTLLPTCLAGLVWSWSSVFRLKEADELPMSSCIAEHSSCKYCVLDGPYIWKWCYCCWNIPCASLENPGSTTHPTVCW